MPEAALGREISISIGSAQNSIPEQRLLPGFDLVPTLSTLHQLVHLHSALYQLSDLLNGRPFPARSPPPDLPPKAAAGDLKPAPIQPAPRGHIPHQVCSFSTFYGDPLGLSARGAPSSAYLTMPLLLFNRG